MKKNKIIVSVFCATYNHGKYIRDALEGFVSQKTSFPFEVIVHDDASTDNTAEVIKEYEKKYPGIIKPIYQSENIHNKKINRNYAYMLPNAKGKYIALCEGDDYWIDEYKLQKQVDYMEQHPECSLIAHKSYVLNCDDGKMTIFSDADFSDTNWDVPQKIAISNESLFQTASMLFKKSYYYTNEQFLRTHPNYDYVYKILLATEGTVHIIPDIMSVYRRNTKGSWTERIWKNNENQINHIHQTIKNLEAINEYKNHKFGNTLKQSIFIREFLVGIQEGNFSPTKISELLYYIKIVDENFWLNKQYADENYLYMMSRFFILKISELAIQNKVTSLKLYFTTFRKWKIFETPRANLRYIYHCIRNLFYMHKIFNMAISKPRQSIRNYCNKIKRLRLKNTDLSLIASNCNGAMILHDLNMRFNSPFVDLWIKPRDFIKMCQNLKNYMNYNLQFTAEEGIDYPVGILKDIRIYFQHYKTAKEAEDKWNQRRQRINYNNIFFLFTDRDGCSKQDLIDFDNLEYKNKAVFVHKPYPDIKSAVYIRGFEQNDSVGMCMNYKGCFSLKRYYDDFDYVSWFNNGTKNN